MWKRIILAVHFLICFSNNANCSFHTRNFCSKQFREVYCKDDENCKSCKVGPKCQIPGRRLNPDQTGTLILRGVTDPKDQQVILNRLNQENIRKTWSDESDCVQILAWDNDLAEAAQAWADQCAMVEYRKEKSFNLSTPKRRPLMLFHDSKESRIAGLKSIPDREFQNIYWARTQNGDLTPEVVEKVFTSEFKFTDNLNSQSNSRVATHAGCGWIQFPVGRGLFENFMVCNFVYRKEDAQVCGNGNVAKNIITYYSAPESIITDVKLCLSAMRCQRSVEPLKFGISICESKIQDCLNAQSGMRVLRSGPAARFEDPDGNSLESQCKLDTILCDLVATNSSAMSTTCNARLRRCWQLLDRPQLPDCKCADLFFSNGQVNTCELSDENGRAFCYVETSPCVVKDLKENVVEVSQPKDHFGRLVHVSYEVCNILHKI